MNLCLPPPAPHFNQPPASLDIPPLYGVCDNRHFVDPRNCINERPCAGQESCAYLFLSFARALGRRRSGPARRATIPICLTVPLRSLDPNMATTHQRNEKCPGGACPGIFSTIKKISGCSRVSWRRGAIGYLLLPSQG